MHFCIRSCVFVYFCFLIFTDTMIGGCASDIWMQLCICVFVYLYFSISTMWYHDSRMHAWYINAHTIDHQLHNIEREKDHRKIHCGRIMVAVCKCRYTIYNEYNVYNVYNLYTVVACIIHGQRNIADNWKNGFKRNCQISKLMIVSQLSFILWWSNRHADTPVMVGKTFCVANSQIQLKNAF